LNPALGAYSPSPYLNLRKKLKGEKKVNEEEKGRKEEGEKTSLNKFVVTVLSERNCYCSVLFYVHRVQKKGATLFFAITLPNPNRSSKFFYHHTQQ